MYLIFETEIDGFPIDWKNKKSKMKKPQLIKLTWGVFDEGGNVKKLENHLIHCYEPFSPLTERLTGICDFDTDLHGEDKRIVLKKFFYDLIKAKHIVAFDFEREYSILECIYKVNILKKHIKGKMVGSLIEKLGSIGYDTVLGSKTHLMSLSSIYFSIYDIRPNLKLTPYSSIRIIAKLYIGTQRIRI